MAELQICLILSFLLFFFLTRIVWVRIIKKKILRIEIHLPLLALHLYFTKDKKKKGEKETDQLCTRAYVRIITGMLRRTRKCRVEIKKIVLPCQTNLFTATTLVKPFAYQGLIYTIIAYLKTQAREIILCDNAIISSPDVNETQFYFTVKLRLFELIYAYLTFRRSIYEEKSKKDKVCRKIK